MIEIAFPAHISSSLQMVSSSPNQQQRFEFQLQTTKSASTLKIMNTTLSTYLGAESDYSSSLAQNELPEYVKILAGILYFISMFLGIGGNLLVLLVVMYYQRMRTVTNFFIFNLAISDLIFALLCIPITYLTAYVLQYWPFSSFLCVFFNYMQNVSVTLTVYTLICITFDKYWAVVKPLKLRMSITMCKILIGISWLFSFFISLPIAIFTKLFNGQTEPTDSIQNHSNYPFYSNSSNQTEYPSQSAFQAELSRPNCGEIWPENRIFNAHSYNIFLFFVQYFIPLILLAFCYARIGIVLRKTKAPGESIQNRDARMLQSKQKLIKMCFLMVLTFMVSWAPMQILTIYRFYNEKIGESSYYGIIFFICHIIAVSRSFICPIIYTWTNLRFRNGFKYLLCFCYFNSEKKYSDQNFQSSEILRMNASFRNGSIRAFNSCRSINRNSSYTNCSFRSRLENRQLHNQSSLPTGELTGSHASYAKINYLKAKNAQDGTQKTTFRMKDSRVYKDSRSRSSSAICKDEYKMLGQTDLNKE